MYLCSNSEVYIQEVDFPNWCISFKLRSILEVDFLNLCIYLETFWSRLKADFHYWCICFEALKYTWSRLSKFMYLSPNWKVYLKYTSFQKSQEV